MNDLVAGQSCPKCGRQSVVYNGNYFCESCTWVMPEKGKHNGRIIKAYLVQRWNAAKKKGDQEEMDFIGTYLTEDERKP